jgi:hypothetical protein
VSTASRLAWPSHASPFRGICPLACTTELPVAPTLGNGVANRHPHTPAVPARGTGYPGGGSGDGLRRAAPQRKLAAVLDRQVPTGIRELAEHQGVDLDTLGRIRGDTHFLNNTRGDHI